MSHKEKENHFRKDRITKSLLRAYSRHPLMTNIAMKTHVFLVTQAGLEPRFKSVFFPDDYTTLAVVKYDPPKTEEEKIREAQEDSFEKTKQKEIKVLIKNNSLDIFLYSSMCLHINYEEDVKTHVVVQLEDLNKEKKAEGRIVQLYIPQFEPTGRFDETGLYGFLSKCVNSCHPRL